MEDFGVIAPKFSLSLLLSCAISLASFQFALAAATDADVKNAIQAANILDANARLNVKVKGDTVHVSTYRDSRENAKDRKINAVLMARAAIQAGGESISRVVVYFYGKDGANYQEVDVSAGDVKAFASGQTTQDQLLSSLNLIDKRNDTASDRVARQLEAGAYARPEYSVALANSDSQLVVTTALADWVADDEALVEAVRIANNAAGAAPAGVKEIKVAFVDPRGKASTREMTFSNESAKSMWQKIQGDLAGVSIAKVAPASVDVAAGGARAVGGALQAERTRLLERLQALEKAGVGIAPFLKAFKDLEDSVATTDEATLKSAVERLSRSLDDQEKAAKAAKLGPTKGAGGDSKPFVGEVKDVGSRWGYGPTPITADEVMQNADAVVNRKMHELPNAQRNSLFVKSLDRIAAVLAANGKSSDAQRFKKQADQLRPYAK
jgi:hypothetical protein